MVATIHDECPIQNKQDLSTFDPNRDIHLFKIDYRLKSQPKSFFVKSACDPMSDTTCSSSRDLTRMIIMEALAYAEEVGASSDRKTEPLTTQTIQSPTVRHPMKNDPEGRRRRLSSPTFLIPSMRDQEARVPNQGLSHSEHGTSNSVVTMSTRTHRRGSLGSSDSSGSSGTSGSTSPRLSPLVRKTRNAEWVVVDSTSTSTAIPSTSRSRSSCCEEEISPSSSRVRAAFALMQENSLPSPKVIRIAALDAAASTRNMKKMEQPPTHNTTTSSHSQSCPSGLYSRAMEAVAMKKQGSSSGKSKTTTSSSSSGVNSTSSIRQERRRRRILQRSQSLGNRPSSSFATATPSRMLQRSQSLGTGRLSLPMPTLLETIDESNEGVVC